MQSDPHTRARFLIDEALATGIVRDDERWLQAHIGGCAACAHHAELTSRMVRELRAISFETDPAMTARVKDSLALQAQPRYRAAPVWRWAAIAAALLIAVAPLYRSLTDKRREAEIEKADTLLLERVNERVSQSLPEAMEPLMQPPQGGKNQ
jgi:hypothetical protein